MSVVAVLFLSLNCAAELDSHRVELFGLVLNWSQLVRVFILLSLPPSPCPRNEILGGGGGYRITLSVRMSQFAFIV